MKKHSLTKQKEVTEDKPTKADYHHGSTTQGGSDFGQGSSQLGITERSEGYERGRGEGRRPDEVLGNRQGSESNSGSSYGNEKKWNNEALRRKDMSKYRQ